MRFQARQDAATTPSHLLTVLMRVRPARLHQFMELLSFRDHQFARIAQLRLVGFKAGHHATMARFHIAAEALFVRLTGFMNLFPRSFHRGEALLAGV
jgi:hypothetical protein